MIPVSMIPVILAGMDLVKAAYDSRETQVAVVEVRRTYEQLRRSLEDSFHRNRPIPQSEIDFWMKEIDRQLVQKTRTLRSYGLPE